MLGIERGPIGERNILTNMFQTAATVSFAAAAGTLIGKVDKRCWAMVPAILLIGVWFLLQIFSQIGSFAGVQNGGVAYAAHIGGFIYGPIAG